MADWYKTSFRRNLIDMHIEDWNCDFLSQFDENVYFIDSSQFKQGMDLCGKKVFSPEVLKTHDIDTVILTTTTYISSAIIDSIKANYHNVKRIEMIGKLFFPLNGV